MFKAEMYDELSFIEQIKNQDSYLSDLNNTDDHIKVQWQEFVNCILTILSIICGVLYYDLKMSYKYSQAVNSELKKQSEGKISANYTIEVNVNKHENLIINLLVVESISIVLFSKFLLDSVIYFSYKFSKDFFIVFYIRSTYWNTFKKR